MATLIPIPSGRGRWRITLHARQYSDLQWSQTMVGELFTARSRRLEQNWCAPAQLSFTIDGRDPEAVLIRELQTDVMAWRWDEYSGRDLPLFRGVVTQYEDEVTEQSHTVNFVCQDYLAMMSRRIFTTSATFTQQDQDNLVSQQFVPRAVTPVSAPPVSQSFSPGGFLPIQANNVNPDGTIRGALSGVLRDRNYTAGADLLTTLDDLAKVIGGFDYDIIPAYLAQAITGVHTRDSIRIFYPYQGVQRFDVPLVYGATVSAFTRTVSSGDYANYWRVIGDSPPNSPDGTPPMFSEQWNSDSNNVLVNPIGLWMETENAADVNIQSTLDQKAQGDLAWTGLLTAGISPSSYTLTMRPGAYRYGNPNMGDICPVVVQTGRLNLNDNVRVLGIAYAIGDDGDEDIELTIGRPTRTLTQLLTQADKDADALTRR
jgi:hypothetical protein